MKLHPSMRLLLACVLLLTAACSSAKKNQMQAEKENNEKLLLGTWMRSHEENGKAGKGIIFRNVKYFTFPPARGRDGFTFSVDSRCVYLGIAPTDGTEELPGKYGWGGKKELRITLENGRSFNYQVQELTTEKLVVIEE
jgi:hypothetical protein